MVSLMIVWKDTRLWYFKLNTNFFDSLPTVGGGEEEDVAWGRPGRRVREALPEPGPGDSEGGRTHGSWGQVCTSTQDDHLIPLQKALLT